VIFAIIGCDENNVRSVSSVNGKDSILDALNVDILNHPNEYVYYVNRTKGAICGCDERYRKSLGVG
jgi:hypothetical protein